MYWAPSKEGGMAQSTWLSSLGSSTATQRMVCAGSVNGLTKLLFHFPSGLAKFYPELCVTKKRLA